jgi:PadR family transcriptional regulator, regulatory protein PadR
MVINDIKQYKNGGAAMDSELGSIETEMKRGFLQLLVLVVLEKDAYGYAMVRAFRDLGYEVEENTLYPLLRRLEKRGLIQGKWELGEERPRKFYAVTHAGREMRAGLLEIWQKQDGIIKQLIKEIKNV